MTTTKNPTGKPVKVLHITDQLSKGGAGRALIGVAKYSTRQGEFEHQCISMKAPFDGVISEDVVEGMPVHVQPSRDEICALMEQADIIHWHWWQDFPLMREDLPRKPTIVWCAVSGEYPPNELPREVVDFADTMVITNPLTRDLPAIRSLPEEERQRKVRLIFESADFERILPLKRIPHEHFNVGWIGTIAPGKYNPRYVAMSSRIDLPNVRFLVCGEGLLKEQAQQDVIDHGMQERFQFLGYQDDMRQIFGLFDVYGFPLDEKTFAGGELNLQEAMAAGLPIVVFPYGGPKRMILHNYNGLIAYSEKEYQDYITYLYYHPEERQRLGANAHDYALREYGAENAARKFNRLYTEMLEEARQRERIEVMATRSSEDRNAGLKRLALFHQGKGNFSRALEFAGKYLAVYPDDPEMTRLVERVGTVAGEGYTLPQVEPDDEVEKLIDTRIYDNYKVTAVVSTYQSEHVFTGCLADLFEQSLYRQGDLEIIIVDSASPEREWLLVEEFCRDHKHVLALRTHQRESLYAAWNRAIRLSRGDYITNANADDRHRQDGLEVLARALDEHPEAAIVYGDSLSTTTTNETFAENSAQDALRWGPYSPEKLEHHCCVGPHPMWRRELHDDIGWFDERYKSAADYDFWLRVSEKYPLLHLDEMLGLFYSNPASLGNAGENVHRERLDVQRRHQERKQNHIPVKRLDGDPLAACATAADVHHMVEEKGLQEVFPDIDWQEPQGKRSVGIACLRVAQRLIQLNDLAGARSYLERSYDLIPLRKTLELMDEIGNTTAAQPAEKLETVALPADTDSAMNILLIANGFPPGSLAGTELHTYWLAKQLLAQGHQVRVLYPEHDPSSPAYQIIEDSYDNIPVARLNHQQPIDRLDIFADEMCGHTVGLYAKHVGADLAHFMHLIGISGTAIGMVRQYRIPTVMTIHDGWLLCVENHFVYHDGTFCAGPESAQKCFDCVQRRRPSLAPESNRQQMTQMLELRQRYLKSTFSSLDKLIVPSIYSQDRFEQYGFTHPNLEVVPHGIPRFKVLPKEPRNEKLRLLFMGHIFYTKGLDLLIDACNSLDPDKVELHIYGLKADAPYFDACMKKVSPAHQVEYHGPYTPTDIPKMLSRSDLVVVPSRSESFSYTVREAFHAKVPVIGPAVGGIPEAILDGYNGFLFQPGNSRELAAKLQEIIADPTIIDRLAENITPMLGVEVHGEHIQKIYRQVLEERRKRPHHRGRNLARPAEPRRAANAER